MLPFTTCKTNYLLMVKVKLDTTIKCPCKDTVNFTPVYQMNFKELYLQGIQYLKSLLCVFCKGYML